MLHSIAKGLIDDVGETEASFVEPRGFDCVFDPNTATTQALKREGQSATTKKALSTQAKNAARKRSAAARSSAAGKAAKTKGASGRSTAARKAARTRKRNSQ